MSEQETVSATVIKLHPSRASELEDHLASLEDDYDRDNYTYENSYYKLGGEWWELKHREDFEFSDFVKVSNFTDTELEFTASWYNGGCGFSEIVQYAFVQGSKK